MPAMMNLEHPSELQSTSRLSRIIRLHSERGIVRLKFVRRRRRFSRLLRILLMSGGSGRMFLLSMGSLRVRNRMALGIREILKSSFMITYPSDYF